MNLKKIRSEDLIFSNEIEDDRTNTYLTLNDYDWMNYNLSTRFKTEEREVEVRYGQKEIQTHMIPVSIETVFEKLKPVCKQKYLVNGREYKKEYEFNE